MEEMPFSRDIRKFNKPIEIGDTNQIYFDPNRQDILIRVPTDYEAKFLVNDSKSIKVAEKYYQELAKLGQDLDIVIAPHQFIVAKETNNGSVKPMLLAKRIEGHQLFPIDKNDPQFLDASNRIALFALRYIQWIQHHKPKSVITDIFRPEQYLATPGKTRDVLTLVDIEPRLKEIEKGLNFIKVSLFNIGGVLCDSKYQDTFRQILQYFLSSLKQDKGNRYLANSINMMVNFPDFYKQYAERWLAGEEPELPPEISKQLIDTPLIIDRALLQRLGIEKI